MRFQGRHEASQCVNVQNVEFEHATSPTDTIDEPSTPRAQVAVFPVRFLGLGLWIVWDWCIHDATSLNLGGWGGEFWLYSGLAMAGATVITLLACAFCSRRLGSISRHRWMTISAVLASFIGTAALVFYVNLGYTSTPLELLIGAIIGYANGILILSWAEVYSCLGRGRVFLFGSISLILAAVCVYILTRIEIPINTIVALLLPLLAFGLCRLSLNYTGKEPIDEIATTRATFPWKPTLIMAICGFSASFTNFTLFSQGSSTHMQAVAIVGALVLVCLLVFRDRMKPIVFVFVSLAAIALGYLIIAFFASDAEYATSLLSMIGYVDITFLVFAMLASLSHHANISSMWLFGFAVAAREFMAHSSDLVALIIPQLKTISENPSYLSIVAVIGLIAVAVIIVIWASERSYTSHWSVEVIDINLGQRVKKPHEILMEKCEKLAELKDLTPRETEIMELLAEGLSYQEICQSLVLSQNTIKSHTRHLYKKVDVNNRAELSKLIESIRLN